MTKTVNELNDRLFKLQEIVDLQKQELALGLREELLKLQSLNDNTKEQVDILQKRLDTSSDVFRIN